MKIEGWNGEIGRAHWWARALSFGAVMGILFGVIGPFGAYPNPLPQRVLHQSIIMIAGTVLAGLLIPLQLRLGLRAGLPRLFILAIALIITAVPIALVAFSVSSWFWREHIAGFGPGEWYSHALLMLTGAIALWILLEIARSAWTSKQIGSPAASPAGSAENRPEPSVGDVLCLQMEDNYVRVHRDGGSHLELMPLHEAILKFGRPDGLQVHRSYWVSAGAFQRTERRGRNLYLKLTNGLTVPVARNRVANLRACAWIGDDHP